MLQVSVKHIGVRLSLSRCVWCLAVAMVFRCWQCDCRIGSDRGREPYTWNADGHVVCCWCRIDELQEHITIIYGWMTDIVAGANGFLERPMDRENDVRRRGGADTHRGGRRSGRSRSPRPQPAWTPATPPPPARPARSDREPARPAARSALQSPERPAARLHIRLARTDLQSPERALRSPELAHEAHVEQHGADLVTEEAPAGHRGGPSLARI